MPSEAPGRHVAILLPLTGPNAEVGQAMLRAAQLSLEQPGSPVLDARDTAGTPEGAAEAAKLALAGGAGLILGPLTAGETAAAAPVAKAGGVPVLAFTSDAALAQPGVWTLGITPAQQVRRLVLAVQAEGRTRVAAVLPRNAFGDALSGGLTTAAAAAGLPEPKVVRYGGSFATLNTALKDVSAYSTRRGAIEQQQQDARARGDADGRRQAAELGQQTPPPPPVDALLLGAAGEQLGQAVPLLAFYDVAPNQVRILGPAIWAREASRLSGLAGAWYAAPDPAQRAPFEQAYSAKYNAPPRELTSLAYDAAGVARVAAESGGFAPRALARPEGFAGADGLLALQPDGQVRRGLAIFEIDRGGSHIVQPAPQSRSAPGV
jgi:ABC-type branched-subunit amino acid transport system substrate-binding protein